MTNDVGREATEEWILAYLDPVRVLRQVQGTAGETATLRDFVVELHGVAEGMARLLIAKGVLTAEELQDASRDIVQQGKQEAAARRRR